MQALEEMFGAPISRDRRRPRPRPDPAARGLAVGRTRPPARERRAASRLRPWRRRLVGEVRLVHQRGASGNVRSRQLVIGSGGREHALVRALSRDDVHAAPGNPGIEALAETHPDTPPTPDGILALARKLAPGLVVIGPEAPLVAGAADALREARIPCFGPDAAAARIEGSKSFAKQVMAEAGIPTAASFTCGTPGQADQALAAFGPPYVVKDDALAAGKGVLVTADLDAARALSLIASIVDSTGMP